MGSEPDPAAPTANGFAGVGAAYRAAAARQPRRRSASPAVRGRLENAHSAFVTTLLVNQALARDRPEIEDLLDDAAMRQHELGADMWTPGQFGEEVRDTIEAGDLFVARDGGELIGCFMLDAGSPRFARWLADNGRTPANGAVIGRLVVARGLAGHGLGIELARHARAIARDRDLSWVWLECPADNAPLREFYIDAGFTHGGNRAAHAPPGDPWFWGVFETPP